MIIAAVAFVLLVAGLLYLAVRHEANQELKKFQRSVKSGKGWGL